MNSKKDSKRQKPRQEGETFRNLDKFQSPLPKKNYHAGDVQQLNLSDISPFRPIYGSCYTPHYIHFSNAGMEFIQTPANTVHRVTFIDQIDESLKQISGIINFDNENQEQDSQNEESGEGSSFETDSLSACQQNIPLGQETAKKSEKSEKEVYKVSMISEENKDKKQNKKNSLSVVKEDGDKKRIFCNCKKTKCLKLYCDCFRDNLMCVEGCNCVGCHNLDEYEDQRNNAMMSLMERNPQAFKPKIQLEKHSKGCHCKKSNCQKKYCQCFQAGLKCGENCKCEQCKNMEEVEVDDKEKGDECNKIDYRRSTVKKERKYHEWAPAV